MPADGIGECIWILVRLMRASLGKVGRESQSRQTAGAAADVGNRNGRHLRQRICRCRRSRSKSEADVCVGSSQFIKRFWGNRMGPHHGDTLGWTSLQRVEWLQLCREVEQIRRERVVAAEITRGEQVFVCGIVVRANIPLSAIRYLGDAGTLDNPKLDIAAVGPGRSGTSKCNFLNSRRSIG